MNDAGIVRNRQKIDGTIRSAQAWIEMGGADAFAAFLWDFVDGRALQTGRETRAAIPAADDLSRRVSKELKARGFAFCGPTVVYAFMQATGLINDHLVGCFRHAECARPPLTSSCFVLVFGHDCLAGEHEG